MKKLLPALALAAIAFAPQAYADMHMKKDGSMMEKKMEAVTTTGVALHSDNCGGCKILGPKMKEVMAALDAETTAKFAMVKFDLTDDASKAESKKIAMEKGVAGIFPEGKAGTGFVKLVDNKTGAVLGKIHYKMSVEEITGLIKGVVGRS
ncbi:MAG: hypothetical protein ACRBCT_08240 [Alphaproteobacteria bacterium]